MTPIEKASELINKFKAHAYEVKEQSIPRDMFSLLWNAKQCAIICVDEIITANPYYFYPGRKVARISDHSTKEYWEEVKQEINNYTD